VRYPTPDDEFSLSVVTADGGTVRSAVTGPEVVLCTSGRFDGLARGEAAIVPGAEREWTLAGEGTLHVVGVGAR
jgi:mannose-6-phosphate isomerase class I